MYDDHPNVIFKPMGAININIISSDFKKGQ